MRNRLIKLLLGKHYLANQNQDYLNLVSYHQDEMKALRLEHAAKILDIAYGQQKALVDLNVLAHENAKNALEASQLAAAIPDLDQVLYKWVKDAAKNSIDLGEKIQEEYLAAVNECVRLTNEQGEILEQNA